MAKTKEKNLAIKLRRQGESIKQIAKILNVSKGSVSLWCQDVRLTKPQIEALNNRMVAGGYSGRLKGALLQKKRREAKIKMFINDGRKITGSLSNRDLLMVGLGLYLGEGNRGRKFQFTNSNPQIIKLIVFWLKKVFGVRREDLIFSIFINESHRDRESIVKNFWKKLLKASKDQFRKTIFIKSKLKKIYDNHDKYFGVLSIRVKRSTDLQYKINGLNYNILNSRLCSSTARTEHS